MKKTALTRKTPLKRTAFVRTLVKPSARSPREVRHWKVARAPKVKQTVFRSDAYLAAVRTLPCMDCGTVGLTEAAHSNQLRFGKGRSLKSSDATAMALCRSTPCRPGCHARHDQGGKLTKVESWAFEYRHICLTVFALLASQKLINKAGCSIPDVVTDWEATAVYFVSLIESGQLEVVK